MKHFGRPPWIKVAMHPLVFWFWKTWVGRLICDHLIGHVWNVDPWNADSAINERLCILCGADLSRRPYPCYKCWFMRRRGCTT